MNRTGDRVELLCASDPHTGLKPGSRGTIEAIDGFGSMFVRWDDGTRFSLIPGKDRWRTLEPIEEGTTVPSDSWVRPPALAQLRHPYCRRADGQLVYDEFNPEYPVPILLPSECEHVETMCRECVSSWTSDWELRVPVPYHERLIYTRFCGCADDDHIPDSFPSEVPRSESMS